ncbi:hypothetical protein BDV18DRAFT_146126 [Aspergillus unguis]
MSFVSINKLHNTRVLLIGGTSGVGFAVARASLEHGASVILASSNENKVQDAVSRLKSLYPDEPYVSRVAGKKCDLGNEENVESQIVELFEFATRPELFPAAADIKKNGGDQEGKAVPIDHIVFTAGTFPGTLHPTDPGVDAAYLRSLNTIRYIGGALVAKHAPAYMSSPSSASNSITYTSGGMIVRPGLREGASLAVGMIGAIEGLTRGLAVDLKPTRVNIVSLGPVRTELLEKLGGGDEKVLGAFEKNMVLGMGRPEDAAEAYLGLMRDGNATGQVIRSDGGFTLM